MSRRNDVKNVVYALSLDGVNFRYVGVTGRSLSGRVYNHKWCALHGNSDLPVHRWIRKYGPDQIKVTVLSQETSETLQNSEMCWIDRLRREGYSLLNITVGGEGARGWTPSPETRAKIGSANRGRVKTQTEIEKRKATLLRKKGPVSKCLVNGCVKLGTRKGKVCNAHYVSNWRAEKALRESQESV